MQWFNWFFCLKSASGSFSACAFLIDQFHLLTNGCLQRSNDACLSSQVSSTKEFHFQGTCSLLRIEIAFSVYLMRTSPGNLKRPKPENYHHCVFLPFNIIKAMTSLLKTVFCSPFWKRDNDLAPTYKTGVCHQSPAFVPLCVHLAFLQPAYSRDNICLHILIGLHPSAKHPGQVYAPYHRIYAVRNSAVTSCVIWRVTRPLRHIFLDHSCVTGCTSELHYQ